MEIKTLDLQIVHCRKLLIQTVTEKINAINEKYHPNDHKDLAGQPRRGEETRKDQ